MQILPILCTFLRIIAYGNPGIKCGWYKSYIIFFFTRKGVLVAPHLENFTITWWLRLLRWLQSSVLCRLILQPIFLKNDDASLPLPLEYRQSPNISLFNLCYFPSKGFPSLSAYLVFLCLVRLRSPDLL